MRETGMPVSDYLPLLRRRLTPLSPDPAWFRSPGGIHGLGHTLRVLCLATAIGIREGVTDEEFNWLRTAALVHDIGRDHDDVDRFHGAASHKKAVRLGLIPADGPIKDICISHSFADRLMLTESAVPRLIRIFKDADGLDRVRIGALDPRYLRTSSGRYLLPAAWPFYLATRDLPLDAQLPDTVTRLLLEIIETYLG